MDEAIKYIDRQNYAVRYRLTEYMNNHLVKKQIENEAKNADQFAGKGSGRPTLETKIIQ